MNHSIRTDLTPTATPERSPSDDRSAPAYNMAVPALSANTVSTAIIMAGGAGTRLRPMTQTLPKPLVPVAGESAMTHILRLLRQHGIRQAVVTLQYRGDQIRKKYGDSFMGIRLFYVEETTPLGTAGGVVNAIDITGKGKNETVLIISGDSVCNIDLRAVIAAHFSSGADGTLVVTPLADPTGFGLVTADGDGRITGFLEKPPRHIWKQLPSRLVNTGIYILSSALLSAVPRFIPWDFGRQVFPDALAAGQKLYACVSNGYWCDIGTAEAFYRCNFDAATGKLGSICAAECGIHSLAGTGCQLSEAAQIENSVLFDGVTIGDGSRIHGAILCENVTIGKDVTIGKGAIVGPNVTLPDHATVPPGAVMQAQGQILQ